MMKIELFLSELQDILQRDDPIHLDDVLIDIEEWDSLAMMALIAWFDKRQGVSITFNHFKNIITVADLAALLPGARDDQL